MIATVGSRAAKYPYFYVESMDLYNRLRMCFDRREARLLLKLHTLLNLNLVISVGKNADMTYENIKEALNEEAQSYR